MPVLDAPLGCRDRWAIHHVFRAHDNKVAEGYFERYIEDPGKTISNTHLEELAKKRKSIVALELEVFRHINS